MRLTEAPRLIEEIDSIIQKFALQNKQDTDWVERIVEGEWEKRRVRVKQAREDWLSQNDIGPYSGR